MTAGNRVTEFLSPHHKNSVSSSENGFLLLLPLSQLFELCLQLAGRQQKADPPPCWLSRCSVCFRFLTAEPCSSMNFAGKWGKCSCVGTATHQSMARNCTKTLEDISHWASRVGCAIYWTGKYLRGKIIVALIFFLRAATLPIWELRFVSLALRLKNMCKGENPASDSVDADPVTWYLLPFRENPWEQGLKPAEWAGGSWCNSFWM